MLSDCHFIFTMPPLTDRDMLAELAVLVNVTFGEIPLKNWMRMDPLESEQIAFKFKKDLDEMVTETSYLRQSDYEKWLARIRQWCFNIDSVLHIIRVDYLVSNPFNKTQPSCTSFAMKVPNVLDLCCQEREVFHSELKDEMEYFYEWILMNHEQTNKRWREIVHQYGDNLTMLRSILLFFQMEVTQTRMRDRSKIKRSE